MPLQQQTETIPGARILRPQLQRGLQFPDRASDIVLLFQHLPQIKVSLRIVRRKLSRRT